MEIEVENVREILRPDPARIMEGLRDTGYDFNTAVADIVDNSISAKADKIDVRVEMDPLGEITIYFADNGEGMDYDGLMNAMKYGSKRRDDPASLGKFGLGLKTASTAFCKCLSLISRDKDKAPYKKMQWDLDFIASKNEWYLLTPEPSTEEIEILQRTAPNGSGTLVVWENNDRIMTRTYNIPGGQQARAALAKNLRNLYFHLSMVYQRFLDPTDSRARTVTLFLNDEQVFPWDPFCKDEPLTEVVAEEEFEIDMGDGELSVFSLKAYVIPRGDNFSSKEAAASAKIGNDMQGFYVYREERLIYQGWLRMYSKEPHGSLLRVEFSFDNKLDEAFNVDIKKSTVSLNDEIFNEIKDNFIKAPRRAADERSRKGTLKAVADSGQSAHDASNRNIDGKVAQVQGAEVTVTNAAQNEVEITNQNGTFKHRLTISRPIKPGQYHVIPVETLTDGILWEPSIVDNRHAVLINQGHPYYQKVYNPVIAQGVMVTGMDALLWALAEAELSTFSSETREQYEDLRVMVSRIIRKLVSDLPDPDVNTEE